MGKHGRPHDGDACMSEDELLLNSHSNHKTMNTVGTPSVGYFNQGWREKKTLKNAFTKVAGSGVDCGNDTEGFVEKSCLCSSFSSRAGRSCSLL